MSQDPITARAKNYLAKYPKAPIEVRIVDKGIAIGIGPASEELVKYMGEGKKLSQSQFETAIREVTQMIGRTLKVTSEPTRTSSGRVIEVTKFEVSPV
ncbi:MAG: hypothetical protein SFW65_04305 [Alphaproteobacteria bacterium]|nr:hypothetical protein [Alphaproteobacteria bacterium]